MPHQLRDVEVDQEAPKPAMVHESSVEQVLRDVEVDQEAPKPAMVHESSLGQVLRDVKVDGDTYHATYEDGELVKATRRQKRAKKKKQSDSSCMIHSFQHSDLPNRVYAIHDQKKGFYFIGSIDQETLKPGVGVTFSNPRLIADYLADESHPVAQELSAFFASVSTKAKPPKPPSYILETTDDSISKGKPASRVIFPHAQETFNNIKSITIHDTLDSDGDRDTEVVYFHPGLGWVGGSTYMSEETLTAALSSVPPTPLTLGTNFVVTDMENGISLLSPTSDPSIKNKSNPGFSEGYTFEFTPGPNGEQEAEEADPIAPPIAPPPLSLQFVKHMSSTIPLAPPEEIEKPKPEDLRAFKLTSNKKFLGELVFRTTPEAPPTDPKFNLKLVPNAYHLLKLPDNLSYEGAINEHGFPHGKGNIELEIKDKNYPRLECQWNNGIMALNDTEKLDITYKNVSETHERSSQELLVYQGTITPEGLADGFNCIRVTDIKLFVKGAYQNGSLTSGLFYSHIPSKDEHRPDTFVHASGVGGDKETPVTLNREREKTFFEGVLWAAWGKAFEGKFEITPSGINIHKAQCYIPDEEVKHFENVKLIDAFAQLKLSLLRLGQAKNLFLFNKNVYESISFQVPPELKLSHYLSTPVPPVPHIEQLRSISAKQS